MTAPEGWIPPLQFSAACAALPLVSIDLILLTPRQELLLGLRKNAPAQGWWFTPGGRIRKNEAFAKAMARILKEETGLPPELAEIATPIGIFDHFYDDSAFEKAVSTHYINLPHLIPLDHAPKTTAMPCDQHSDWQWISASRAAEDPTIHPYARVYAKRVLHLNSVHSS